MMRQIVAEKELKSNFTISLNKKESIMLFNKARNKGMLATEYLKWVATCPETVYVNKENNWQANG